MRHKKIGTDLPHANSGISCETFLIHPSQGYEDREKHIKSQLESINIPYHPIDTCDADSDSLNTQSKLWFRDYMLSTTENRKSCTAKHLTAYQIILERNLPGALILEDDVILSSNFCEIFNRSLEELNSDASYRDQPIIISYEDTRLRFVERSRRKKGKLLYIADRDRMTAAYYINNKACKLMLQIAENKKFGEPIDIEHKNALRNRLLTYLWCQPTIASQGSFNGKFKSAISSKQRRFAALIWTFKLSYHKFLYFLR